MPFTWAGLQELKAALRTMPETLTEEATPIVTRRAARARDQIDAAYPVGPDKGGHLKGRTRLTVDAVSRHGVSITVRNTHPQALSFEYGTQVRRTSKGWKRGAMPPGNVFKPIAERERNGMYEELVDLLKRNGHEVSGAR